MNFWGGWEALQGGQMSQDTGTGHGSEGGTDPTKAASQGTQCKGSPANPRPGPPASLHQPSVPGCLHPPQTAETLQAATILPPREENKCIRSSSSRILPFHGASTPWQGILPAPKSPWG